MKIFLKFVGILAVILIIFAVGVGFYVGPIAKAAIENLGPKITKVPVTVEAVNVSLPTGTAGVKELVIGNPEGFQNPQAMSLGNASIRLNPKSVFSDKIVIHSIRIDSPEIFFEGGLGGNNLSKIMDNVNASAGSHTEARSPETSAQTTASSTEKPAPKLQVDEFLITGAKTHVILPGITSAPTTLTLPEIRLTGLGQSTEGITAAELLQKVLTQVTSTTFQEVAKAVPNAGDALKNLGTSLPTKEGAIEKIKSTIGGQLLGK